MRLRISDLNIEVAYDILENAQKHYQDYLVGDDSTGVDIKLEDDICELGEQLPLFGRMIVHGVAIAVNESAFIITAASGTGKSTHAFLWRRLLGEDSVEVINGDKPIVRMEEDSGERQEDEIMVYGSPWCGKEGLQKNTSAPLRGILLLNRLDDEHPVPEIEQLDASGKEYYFDFMMPQTFMPHNMLALQRTFEMLEHIYNKVPIYRLYADMSKECIEMSVGTVMGDLRQIQGNHLVETLASTGSPTEM